MLSERNAIFKGNNPVNEDNDSDDFDFEDFGEQTNLQSISK